MYTGKVWLERSLGQSEAEIRGGACPNKRIGFGEQWPQVEGCSAASCWSEEEEPWDDGDLSMLLQEVISFL